MKYELDFHDRTANKIGWTNALHGLLLMHLTLMASGCLTFTGLGTDGINVTDDDAGGGDADGGDGTTGDDDTPGDVPSDTPEGDGTDDADGGDGGDSRPDDDTDDVLPDTDGSADADTSDVDSGIDDGRNACGGTGTLTFNDEPAGPGDACACDGTLVCDGLDELRCAGASINACGGCGLLGVEIGQPCDACGDAVWTCIEDRAECVGGREDTNLCGGCEPLSQSLFINPDEFGIYGLGWACSDGTNLATATLTCETSSELGCIQPRTATACGGDGALVNVETVCGACGAGRQTCDGNGVFCDIPPGPVTNACGGCMPLAAAPGGECGACGTWVCSDDDESVFCERTVNACGGCGELPQQPGDSCTTAGGEAGITGCLGEDAVRCYATGSNLCGAIGSLSDTPGVPCGQCGAGVLVCADGALVCDESVTLNACGGCSQLSGSPGSTCAPGHTWICDGEESVTCERSDWMLLSVDPTPATVEPLVVTAELSLDVQLQPLRVQRDLRRLALDFGVGSLLDGEVRAIRAIRTEDLDGAEDIEVLSGVWIISELPGYPFPRGVIARMRVPARSDAYFTPLRPGGELTVLPATHDGTTLNVVLREPGVLVAAASSTRACGAGTSCPAGQFCSNGGTACVQGNDFYATNGQRLCRSDADCSALGARAFCHDGTGVCSIPPTSDRCTAAGQRCFSSAANNGSLVCDVLAAVCRQDCTDNESACLTGTACATGDVYGLDSDPANGADSTPGVCIPSSCDPTAPGTGCDGTPAFDNPSVLCTTESCYCQPVAPGLAGCIQQGDREVGQSCDETPVLDGRFRCQAGLVCAEGTCSQPCTPGSDTCESGTHPNCVAGRSCECLPLLDTTTSPPVGVCGSRCEPQAPPTCGDQNRCVPWIEDNVVSGWFCAFNRQDGGPPIPVGEKCSTADADGSVCEEGACAGSVQGEGTCELLCSLESEEGCLPNQFCNPALAIPDLGLCSTLCEPFPRLPPEEVYDGCTPDQSCRPVNRGSLPDIDIVGQCITRGTIPIGEQCETDGLGTCEDLGICRPVSGDPGAPKACYSLCTFDGQITCPSSQVCDGIGLLGGQVASYWCTEVPGENSGRRIGDNCNLEGVICGDGISLCTSLGTGALPTCVQLCALGFNDPGCISGTCQVGAFGPSFPFGGVCLQ